MVYLSIKVKCQHVSFTGILCDVGKREMRGYDLVAVHAYDATID
jgi:hypothetical protein